MCRDWWGLAKVGLAILFWWSDDMQSCFNLYIPRSHLFLLQFYYFSYLNIICAVRLLASLWTFFQFRQVWRCFFFKYCSELSLRCTIPRGIKFQDPYGMEIGASLVVYHPFRYFKGLGFVIRVSRNLWGLLWDQRLRSHFGEYRRYIRSIFMFRFLSINLRSLSSKKNNI